MSNPLRLNLVLDATPVTLVNSDGAEETYEIREMMAAVRDKYMDQLGDRMKVGPDGKVIGVKKFDGLQASLLSVCLYDKDGKLVPQTVIQAWPGGVVSSLFDEAQRINRLTSTKEEVTEEVKKG